MNKIGALKLKLQSFVACLYEKEEKETLSPKEEPREQSNPRDCSVLAEQENKEGRDQIWLYLKNVKSTLESPIELFLAQSIGIKAQRTQNQPNEVNIFTNKRSAEQEIQQDNPPNLEKMRNQPLS